MCLPVPTLHEADLGACAVRGHVQTTATPAEGAMVAHAYGGGTRCDETNGSRHAVVHYVCEPGSDNMVKSITEDSVCSYSIIFATPLLCRHPSVRSLVGSVGGAGSGLKSGGAMDLLSGLEGSCFYRVEGWWTYEFCFLKAVKQVPQRTPHYPQSLDPLVLSLDPPF